MKGEPGRDRQPGETATSSSPLLPLASWLEPRPPTWKTSTALEEPVAFPRAAFGAWKFTHFEGPARYVPAVHRENVSFPFEMITTYFLLKLKIN